MACPAISTWCISARAPWAAPAWCGRDDLCVARRAHHAGCPGLWNDAQRDAWKRIVDFVHANSDTKIAMQLGHAGRKGSTQLAGRRWTTRWRTATGR
jgi:2,4-dienoyl-CoA reductase-like NADH-dependent reductase (Old Yellow Enzyme family)